MQYSKCQQLYWLRLVIIRMQNIPKIELAYPRLSLPSVSGPVCQVQPPKPPPSITNYYIQQLKRLFKKQKQSAKCIHFNGHHGNSGFNIDNLINIFSKAGLHYLVELGNKIGVDDFRNFVMQLVLIEREYGFNVVQRGKKSNMQLLLIQGEISYQIKTEGEGEEEMINVGVGYPGFVIYPQVFMSPKYVNFTVVCEKNCTFLGINQQIYNKYLKKLMIKQIDHFAQFLSQVPIFHELGALNIRKYLSYFIMRSYKYNQMIYSAGSEMNQIFFILKGSVQIFNKKGETQINIVNLGQGQCFGLNGQGQNTRRFNAKCIDSQLKVAVLNSYVLQLIKFQNPIVVQNCLNYLQKTEKFHSSILTKNIKILDNKQQLCIKIAKKKKKKQRKPKNSLTWWGLAENVKIQHKYRMPKHPQTVKLAKQSSPDDKSPRTLLLTHKIQQLKKRILQNETEQDQILDNEKQNDNEETSPYKISNNYVPKIKARIKMLQAKPKVIDMAEIVKKKLITYAKNMGSFCDRLNLQ